jgi:DNA helicase II / ATP-dependent DNA helicase PcrA
LSLILDFEQNVLSTNPDDMKLRSITNYCDDAIKLIGSYFTQSLELEQYIHSQKKRIQNLKKGEISTTQIIEFLYELIAFSPFSTFIKDDNAMRNLAKLSHFLRSFKITIILR